MGLVFIIESDQLIGCLIRLGSDSTGVCADFACCPKMGTMRAA